MLKMIRLPIAIGMMAALGADAYADGAKVLFNDAVVEIASTLDDPTDLWVAPDDLTRINGFVLKPEGACLDDICIVAREDVDGGLVINRDGKKWFNVTELARKLQQAFVHDADTGVWSFGEIPVTRKAFLESGLAPDFALEDRNGDTVRLSDLRGKKVMIITWASW